MGHDELEFQNIYDSFQPKILRYLKRLVGENEAEDLTQEVFIKVAQALKNFRGEAKPSTWIYRIATNAAFDKLRSPSFQRTAQERVLDDSTEQSEAAAADSTAWTKRKMLPVEQQLVRREMSACILSFVEKLPEHYRAVLMLSEFEGLSNKAIAKILGITLDTVKIRLHRAREKLKEELSTHCDPDWVEENEFVPNLNGAK